MPFTLGWFFHVDTTRRVFALAQPSHFSKTVGSSGATSTNAEERSEFIADIAAAIRELAAPTTRSDDEQRWVRMAIKREAQISEFRKAIIEKTLGGLLWAAVVAIGYFALDFLKTLGFGP